MVRIEILTEIVDDDTICAPVSVSMPGQRGVCPLEAYLTASGRGLAKRCTSIADLKGGTTTIAPKKGTNTVSGLTRSIYIVNGQKVL